MPKATSKSVLLVTGLILVAAGLGVFAWYNTVVLDAAEIKRLEAGGSSNGTMGELLMLIASPVLVLLGAVLLYMAWSRRGRPDVTRGLSATHVTDVALHRH